MAQSSSADGQGNTGNSAPQTNGAPAAAKRFSPDIKAITRDDIQAALRAGIDDFKRAQGFGLFFGGIYAIGGMFIWFGLVILDTTWMIIPVAVGFPLIGPFVAVGLYEVSRRLAAGEKLSWSSVLLVIVEQRKREMAWMAFAVLFIFWIWMYQTRLLVALFFGLTDFATFGSFLDTLLGTNAGLWFLFVGTGVGAVLATVLFASTVTAMPLLLERDVDFITGIITSFKTVMASPAVMIRWGLIIAAAVMLAMLPLFLGLFVVLPVLGHATWHLYKTAISFPDEADAA